MITVNRLFCMRLHTAGVVIGWVGAALSFINVVLYSLILSRLDEIIKFITDHQDADPAISPENLKSVAVAGIAIYLTLTVVNLISSVLLIAGTIKERHLMLIPWLINNGFVLFLSVLNAIYIIYYSIANGDSFGPILGLVIISGLILGLEYYIWTGIYSLMRHIRSLREQQLIPNKAGQAHPSYTRIY